MGKVVVALLLIFIFVCLVCVVFVRVQDVVKIFFEEGGLIEIIVIVWLCREFLCDVFVVVIVIEFMLFVNNFVIDLSKVVELVLQVLIGCGVNGMGVFIIICGISFILIDVGFDQSILVSMDGMQLSCGRVVFVFMFDVDQVEILQGLQVLFFGKNFFVGVIFV